MTVRIGPPDLYCNEDNGAVDSGGGGGSPASTPPSSASAPAPSASAPNGGGARETDAGHSFGRPAPPNNEGLKVREILNKGRDPEYRTTMDDIRALMGYEPQFVKADAEPDDEMDDLPDPAAAASAEPAAPVVASQAPPALDPNVAALVEAMKSQQRPATPAAQPKPDAPKPYYGGHVAPVEVAPELVADLFNSEQPERSVQAVNHLVNGIMNRVMADTQAQMADLYKATLQNIPLVVQNHSTASESTRAFYTQYPELNKPAMKNVVNIIAKTMIENAQKAGKPVSYNAEFLTALGENVHRFAQEQYGFAIPRTAPAAGRSTPVAPANPKASKAPRFISQGGARPPAASHLNGKSAENDILSSLI